MTFRHAAIKAERVPASAPQLPPPGPGKRRLTRRLTLGNPGQPRGQPPAVNPDGPASMR
jgi:hypothetical protein